jgi:hypothetical protein
VSTDRAAAIDSLMLLRIDLLSALPTAASALQSAIAELRAGHTAMPSLRAARLAIAGAAKASSDTRWSGAW